MTITAILLIGHSNSGKSPLGQYIECAPGKQFFHLDFGEQLRMTARGDIDAGLQAPDIDYVCSVLDGTLLDRKHFYIAEAIISHFLRDRQFDSETGTLVLNGIPRSLEQACDIAASGIDIRMVIHCACSVEHAAMRKQMSEKGTGHEDRSIRDDNSAEIFAKKIRSFEQQTHPLIQHYALRSVPIVEIPVLSTTTPAEAYQVAHDSLQALS